MKQFIVVGIHTGIGKTVASSVLCQALNADYWKPVQAGDLDQSDSISVKSCSSESYIFKEQFSLQIPASPHYAAKEEGIEIKLSDFEIPTTQNNLIIETAGGVMSPLSDTILNLDLINHFNKPVFLVSENYLGSINHTMLTIQALKNRNIEIIGIIFNGEKNEATESFILQYSQIPYLFHLPKFVTKSESEIASFAESIRPSLISFLNR